MRFVQHWASWGKRQKIEEMISGCCVGNTWSAAVLAYCSKLSKANKRQGFLNEKTARNWKYRTIKTENKYVQMLKCANLQILSDVWCKELGQPVAVVGCKWSGANGATADRHDSRMIYICLFVCWFKIQEGLPEGGYSYQHPSILCLEHVWSGTNGATANCHNSRMIYVCWFA